MSRIELCFGSSKKGKLCRDLLVLFLLLLSSSIATAKYWRVSADSVGNEGSYSPYWSTGMASGFDFSLSNSGGITVVPGGSGSNTITVTLVSGIPQTVTLSADIGTTGIAFAAIVSFNPRSGNPKFTSTCMITTSSSVLHGSYPITVIGTGGGLTRTTSFTLTITSQDEKGRTRIALDSSPKPAYVDKPVTISGVLYGSWRCIRDGMVVTKPIEITTGWCFTATLTTDDYGRFSITTTCPSTGGTYTITATFYEDEDLTGSSTTISYEVTAKIATTLTVQIITIFQGYGVPPMYSVAGYLRTKEGGLPIAGKTIYVTVRTAMGETRSYECSTDARGYYRIPDMFTDRPTSATAESKGDADYEPSTASTR